MPLSKTIVLKTLGGERALIRIGQLTHEEWSIRSEAWSFNKSVELVTKMKDCYLSIIDTVGFEDNPFKSGFQNGIQRLRYGMSEEEFNQEFGQFPSEWVEEIHSEVMNLNPQISDSVSVELHLISTEQAVIKWLDFEQPSQVNTLDTTMSLLMVASEPEEKPEQPEILSLVRESRLFGIPVWDAPLLQWPSVLRQEWNACLKAENEHAYRLVQNQRISESANNNVQPK